MALSNRVKSGVGRRDGLFLVFLLITLSGNPVITTMVTESRYVIAASILFLLCYRRLLSPIYYNSSLLLIKHLGIIALVFLGQTIVFGWNTFPGIINFFAKTLTGVFVYLILGYQFKHAYLKIMSFISAICLFFWLLQVLGGITLGWEVSAGKTVFFYTNHFRNTGELVARNAGFFWEPGAFACYLNLAFILFFNEPKLLLIKYRKESIVILLTMLSTQSTTGYIMFGVMLMIYLLIYLKSGVKYLLIPIFLFSFYYIYNSAYFLSEKIETQTEGTIMAGGDFNSSRLGSLAFDLKYILKHPILGNGLHSKTLFADDPWLWKAMIDGEQSYSGNGLSGLIKSMGLFFFFFYCYVFFKNNRSVAGRDKFFVLFFLSLLLFGEPLANYPFVLGLPFLKLKEGNGFVLQDK